MRDSAKLSENEYPEICDMIHKDFYVDDCLYGSNSLDQAYQKADELTTVLSRGGFQVKGFTFSNHKPVEKLSDDVAGMK